MKTKNQQPPLCENNVCKSLHTNYINKTGTSIGNGKKAENGKNTQCVVRKFVCSANTS